MFESFRRSLREMFASTDKMLEEADARFKELDEEVKRAEADGEAMCIEEVTRSDGTRIVTKTIRRSFSVTKRTEAKK